MGDQKTYMLTDVSLPRVSHDVWTGGGGGGHERHVSGATIDSNFQTLSIAVNALNREVKALTEFYNWIQGTHPEVLQKYVTTRTVIERMEREQKK